MLTRSPTVAEMVDRTFRLFGHLCVRRTAKTVTTNNNNNHDDIYSAAIVAEPLREFTRFTR